MSSSASTQFDQQDLDRDVAGCAAAHQRLLSHLDALLDAEQLHADKPSVLPGWSTGHVLTHLARNADAFTYMLAGGELGETRMMYPSAESRDRDIDAGASRDAGVLVSDVRTAIWRLEQQWSQLTSVGWNGFGIARGGQLPLHEVPFRRWREVEIHHADLDAGFSPSDWSTDFVRHDAPRLLAAAKANGNEIPDEVVEAKPWQQVAWAMGRECGLSAPAPTM